MMNIVCNGLSNDGDGVVGVLGRDTHRWLEAEHLKYAEKIYRVQRASIVTQPGWSQYTVATHRYFSDLNKINRNVIRTHPIKEWKG